MDRALAEQPATKERIYEAATRLFYERGYHGTTMRDIAAAVGIKAASLYNHYPGKQDLLYQVARRTMEDLSSGARRAMDPYTDPHDQLHALVVWHVTFHADRRFEAKVADEQLHALEPRRRRQAIKLRDAYEDLFKDVLGRGQALCRWRVPDVPVLTFAIATMCTAVGTWYREDSRLSAEEIAGIYADFVLAALEPASDA